MGVRTGLERVSTHVTHSVCSPAAGGTVSCNGGGRDDVKWSHKFLREVLGCLSIHSYT